MKAAMDLFSSLGVKSLDCRQDGAKLGDGPRESWLFNTTIAGIESLDRLLLIGTNPRREAPLLNARIRKAWLKGKLNVGLIGEAADLRYGFDYLGAGPASLAKLVEGEGGFFKDAKSVGIVVGQGALARSDGAAVLNLAAKAAATFGGTP